MVQCLWTNVGQRAFEKGQGRVISRGGRWPIRNQRMCNNLIKGKVGAQKEGKVVKT